MNDLSITDSFFLEGLEAYFDDTCTITLAGSPVSGLVDLKCRLVKSSSTDLRTPDYSQIAEEWDLLLMGVYPVTTANRVTVGAVDYRIIGVMGDSVETYTKLRLDKAAL